MTKGVTRFVKRSRVKNKYNKIEGYEIRNRELGKKKFKIKVTLTVKK